MPSILVGHVWLTEFDKEALPASLSPRVTQQLLRDEIGYDGFLMSDDMPVMKAIVDHWGLPEAAVMAINAGLDNLLISGTIEQIEGVHQALAEAVQSGEITSERLESALRRRKAALKFCSSDRPAAVAERERLLQREIQAGNAIAMEVSSRCVRKVRGDVLNPLVASDDWVLVVPNHPRYKLDLLTHLSSHMRAGAPALRERRYSLNPMPDEIEEVVTFAHGKRCLFITFRALLHDGQMELARRLALTNPAGVVVASDVPYELDELPEWKNAIATFDPSELAMQSLASVLTGKTLPI
jgi:beta-N-acetylhexosaminidase